MALPLGAPAGYPVLTGRRGYGYRCLLLYDICGRAA
ncbi:hypothetical protein SAMN05443287_103410 [Micromonospora phaseoli]|uniref:Uncharacterized protein n=1 Tax=Micromonospora phaseoli TaxID=1144548 RepID=A0A1H6X3Z8_9ACTN|nr:hypothetical protein CLV64_102408 [Micromonospora phaseoli]SEJ22776.1 hypothetical protein SAMN05443287_103410 [Micromonospora phaseoli]